MKICYVSPEIFHWGIYGGFGYLTRLLSKKLAERGVDVSVITQRRKGQNNIEVLDGVKIYGYPPHSGALNSILARQASKKYYKLANADIYHSQAVSYNTFIAQISCPTKKHILTLQDPYDREEWNRIAKVEPKYGTIKNKIKIEAEIRFLKHTCDKMDRLYSQAHFLVPKAVKLFGLKKEPKYLPNPVTMPRKAFVKSENPTVCFLGRWDPQKRVELFFQLAKQFPEIHFITMGKGHDYVKDEKLRKDYSKIPNLDLTGFVSEAEKNEILGKSWALINTSVREALPISFLEALACRTPIISGENPDELVSKFGYHIQEDNYQDGLKWLLDSDSWKKKGEMGRKEIEKIYEVDKVVDLHIIEYEEILEGQS